MTDPNRVAGVIEFQINGTVYKAVGSFSYNLGQPMREAVVGHDSTHGYKELPQAPFIEGEVRTIQGLKIKDLLNVKNSTVTLKLATGQTIMVSDAWFEGEGTGSTEEGVIPVKFCGQSAEEV